MKTRKITNGCFLGLALVCLILSIPVYAGKVVGWGSMKPPDQSLNQLSSIAAGNDHNLALKADGSIVAWGRNWKEQAVPPAGTDFIAIAAGGGSQRCPEV